MIDFECNHLDRGIITKTKFSTLARGKRILLCSVVRPVDEFSITYVHYLNDIFQKYKQVVDQLMIVDGHNENWIHPCYNNRFPHIKTITDTYLQLVNNLKSTFRPPEEIQKLNQHWSYQLLISDCVIEKFYHRPVTVNWKDFITHENIKKFIQQEQSTDVLKFLSQVLKKKEYEFYNPLYVHDHHRNYQPLPDKLRKIGRYYNIWPNLDLENTLQEMVDRSI